MAIRSNTRKVSSVSLVTSTELDSIEANARTANDPYTLAEVARARRGDAMAQLACAMILGR